MNVDDDDWGPLAQLEEPPIGTAERIVGRRHERASHNVQYRDGHAVGGKGRGASPRHARRIVGRTDYAIAGLEVFGKVALVERVIAAGNEVDTTGKHLFSGLRGQPEAACGILTVGNAGVDVMLLAEQRHATFEDVPPSGTDDVPDQQKVQGAFYRRADVFAFF